MKIEHGGALHLKNEKITIRPIEEEYREIQLQLFNQTFGKSFSISQWTHKHFENPYVDTSENIGLFDGNKLIGFNMFMPQEYFVNGQKKLFLQSCESVVDSNYRGCGYLGKILQQAERILSKQYPVIYGIPNDKSKRTFEKLGYKIKFQFDEMRIIGNKGSMLKELLVRICNRARKDLISINEKKILEKKLIASNHVEILDRLPANWNPEVRTGIKINNSSDFYDWKISSNRKNNMVRKFVCWRSNGEIKAFCVVAFSAVSGSCRGEILDVFCLENEKDSLKNILCYLKKCCSVVTMLVPESGALKTFLLNEGFHVHHAKVAPLIYKMIQEDATELEAVLDEPNNWEFHFIEADTVLN